MLRNTCQSNDLHFFKKETPKGEVQNSLLISRLTQFYDEAPRGQGKGSPCFLPLSRQWH